MCNSPLCLTNKLNFTHVMSISVSSAAWPCNYRGESQSESASRKFWCPRPFSHRFEVLRETLDSMRPSHERFCIPTRHWCRQTSEGSPTPRWRACALSVCPPIVYRYDCSFEFGRFSDFFEIDFESVMLSMNNNGLAQRTYIHRDSGTEFIVSQPIA